MKPLHFGPAQDSDTPTIPRPGLTCQSGTSSAINYIAPAGLDCV